MPVLQTRSYQIATGPVAERAVGGTVRAATEVMTFTDPKIAEWVKIAMNDSRQQRKGMRADPILMAVARDRALDMAQRSYFNHTNPDGFGPNHFVRLAGYNLPSHYPTRPDANSCESIMAGSGDAIACWDAWMRSVGHKKHVCGEIDFFREQLDFGIGRVELKGSPYTFYWCFLSARRP